MLYHKVSRLLAGSLLLSGCILATPALGRADDLKPNAIIVQGGTTRSVLFGDRLGTLERTNPGSLVQLNPQPLPPDRALPGSFVQLNPQPEPPGRQADLGLK